MRINAPLDAVGGARAAAAVSWTPQAGPGGFRFALRAWFLGVCEVGLLWTPKASRGRRRRVLDAQGGARGAAGTGGMCRAAAGANGLGFVGLDLGLRVRGASPVSRGRRHLCARCGSTRELGVPCCISIWALGFASHRSHVHCLWSFVFPVRSCSVGPPVCPVVRGFRSVGSRVRCQVSSWAGAGLVRVAARGALA